MKKTWIKLNGKTALISDIADLRSESTFESQTIDFIMRWLNGDRTFQQQTSGSTGQASTITISRKAMELSVKKTAAALGLKAGQNALLCLNPTFIAGKMILARALELHMNIVAEDPSSLSPSLLDESNIHFVALTPMQVDKLLLVPHGAVNLNKTKSVIIGGAPIDHTLLAKIKLLECPVYATFGMTETVSHIALKRLNGPDAQENFQVLPKVEIGMDKRECLTINADVTGYETIVTNDRVRIISPSEFEWLGRIDNVINSGGIKISSEKVEKTIHDIFEKLKITNRFFIGGTYHRELGEQVSLLVESDHILQKEDELKQLLAKNLSKYENPKRIIYVPQFLETETQKIRRQEILNNTDSFSTN